MAALRAKESPLLPYVQLSSPLGPFNPTYLPHQSVVGRDLWSRSFSSSLTLSHSLDTLTVPSGILPPTSPHHNQHYDPNTKLVSLKMTAPPHPTLRLSLPSHPTYPPLLPVSLPEGVLSTVPIAPAPLKQSPDPNVVSSPYIFTAHSTPNLTYSLPSCPQSNSRTRCAPSKPSRKQSWKRELVVEDGDKTVYSQEPRKVCKVIGPLSDITNFLAECIVSHFEGLYASSRPRREDIAKGTDSLRLVVDASMAVDLLQPCTEVEVSKALFQIAPLKSPGPDGMSPIFFQHFWHIIGNDVIACVLNLLNNHVMPPGLNATHIVLIPKCKHLEFLSHFRPISLCNVVYKIASKARANRLKVILDDMISPVQAGQFAGHAGVALGCQLSLRRSVPIWVSFHGQAGGCLCVTGADNYLGMAVLCGRGVALYIEDKVVNGLFGDTR
ncbi:UNVERIFIED_CONTAM: hypothetical protein Sradi_2707500 [Sesamum radiatum]|uniref:Reverse transcriptase n=1 Tax=Sesamum radiatum TaxID=300843 RepID=A0AAW2S7D6_SESRA